MVIYLFSLRTYFTTGHLGILLSGRIALAGASTYEVTLNQIEIKYWDTILSPLVAKDERSL